MAGAAVVRGPARARWPAELRITPERVTGTALTLWHGRSVKFRSVVDGPGENWEETLRREMDEEACATVVAARLLGFTRGQCLIGPEGGRVLVRSVWRADVELRPWEARFEIVDRRVVAAAAVEDALSLGSHPFAAIIRRELAEAALTT
jgi:hypothetical protein